MGREIKRVPLDFEWPLNKVWEGFLNPHYKPCPDPNCQYGYTPARIVLQGAVSLLMIAGTDGAGGPREGRIWPHPYLRHIGPYRVETMTPDATELSTALAGRKPNLLGHDCCDEWAAEKKIIEAAGLDPKTWGICPTCHGDGVDPATQAQYEAWKRTDPLQGPGWQVWETVSEGSPISPVFETGEACAKWLVDQGYSANAAVAFVENGWVPSMVMVGGVTYNDIESAALQARD